MLDFPGCDEKQQSNGRVSCCASAEHNLACVIIAFVAARAETATARADVGDDSEGEETQSTHEETVDKLVGDEFGGEDALLHIVRWAVHAVFLRFLESKTDGEEGRGDEVDPENFNGGEGEDGVVVLVFEGKTDKQEDDLGDVGNEQMHQEL